MKGLGNTAVGKTQAQQQCMLLSTRQQRNSRRQTAFAFSFAILKGLGSNAEGELIPHRATEEASYDYFKDKLIVAMNTMPGFLLRTESTPIPRRRARNPFGGVRSSRTLLIKLRLHGKNRNSGCQDSVSSVGMPDFSTLGCCGFETDKARTALARFSGVLCGG